MGLLTLSAAVGATAVALSGWNLGGGGGGMLPTADAAVFNAIVPNLSTGWYSPLAFLISSNHLWSILRFSKPGPSESLLFGLIVLKVMAMRMAGLFPYNLNELWEENGLFQNGLSGIDIDKIWRRKSKSSSRVQRDLFFAKLNKYSKAPLLKEIDAVERILLGLRRIDSHDCFIRHVCQIKQKQIAGKSTHFDDSMLQIFSLKPHKKANDERTTTVWDIYHDALTPEVIDCNKKYQMCPLTKKDMSVESLLSGFF